MSNSVTMFKVIKKSVFDKILRNIFEWKMLVKEPSHEIEFNGFTKTNISRSRTSSNVFVSKMVFYELYCIRPFPCILVKNIIILGDFFKIPCNALRYFNDLNSNRRSTT
jgi:hypothetical protein